MVRKTSRSLVEGDKMSEKLIKSEEIQSVQVYLENYAENENTSFSAGILEDESAHELNNTLKAVGDSSKDLVIVVKGLNTFLDKVADAFEKSDKELEGMIDGGIKEIPFGTRSQRQDYFVSKGKNSSDRFYRQKMAEIHNSQFNDFPK